jgi:hypothetical protein
MRVCFTAVFFIILNLLGTNLTAACAGETPFDPVSFGVNIDSSLSNPLDDPQHSETPLRQEVATILYGVSRMGGRTIRWFSDDVWRQYRCGRDPEDQSSGDIDPAWYRMTRILLEEAQRQDVKVVISLMNLANGTFSGLPKDVSERAKAIAEFANYRASRAGKDSYEGDHDCTGSLQNGYYGQIDVREMFERAEIRERMRRRFMSMALYLKDFSALGAIELFNEPSFDFTHQPLYASTVRQWEKDIRDASPRLSRIPVYSGTAYWDRGIAAAAIKTGDLEQEPFVTVHSYIDYTQPERASTSLDRNIEWVQGLIPDKRLVIAEAGDDGPTPLSLEGNATMVRLLFKEALTHHVGLWVWGDDTSWEHRATPNFKWSFSPLSLAGGSFRPFFIDVAAEQRYADSQRLKVYDFSKKLERSENVSISQVPGSETESRVRLRWRLKVGGDSFLSFTRDGILTRESNEMSSLFAKPAPTLLIDERPQSREWAQVTAAEKDWRLEIYRCDQAPHAELDTRRTPQEVIGLALKDDHKEFQNCSNSVKIASGIL